MSQFNSPTVRRTSGGIDVYTGLLCAALLILAAGVFLLAKQNIEHSSVGGAKGSMFQLVE